MLFSDLAEKPYEFVQEIQQFLGIDYYNLDNFTVIHENPALETQEGKMPHMDTQTRQWLVAHYAAAAAT